MSNPTTIPPIYDVPVDEITFMGERVTHLYPSDVYIAHLSIYRFALEFCQGKQVLDAGSGTGYGSAYLAKNGAAFVQAFDVDEKAAAFSRYHFPLPNLEFREMDISAIQGYAEHSFDVIFSSNALEHVPDVFPFFRSAWELLKADGTLIIAVPPVVDETSITANLGNPYHLNIWSPRQWAHQLSLYFGEVQAYRHNFDLPGVELNFVNTPEETRITENDFSFPPVMLEDLYRQNTLTVILTARRPRPVDQLPAPGSPATFVDESYTRPFTPPPTPQPAPQPAAGRLARAGQILREQGLMGLVKASVSFFRRRMGGI